MIGRNRIRRQAVHRVTEEVVYEVEVPDDYELDPTSLDYGPENYPDDPDGYRDALEHDRVEAYFLNLNPAAFRKLPFTVVERHVELGEETDGPDPW